MISRRQILSQTVSDEQTDQYQDLYSSGYGKVDEGDVWYTQDRLFEDHLSEIYNKWNFLDDDIWCKLIIMERNRRIGKAYARTPVISIDGSHEFSFDGFRLGLNSFENPDRDPITAECKTRLDRGIKIRMDESGNIIIARLSKSNAYVKSWQHQLHNHHNGNDLHQSSSGSGVSSNGSSKLNMSGKLQNSKQTTNESSANQMSGNMLSPSFAKTNGHFNDHAISDEILKLNGEIKYNKTYLLFDMKKFQANIAYELHRQYPDKKKLEQQCFSIVSLVEDANDILNLPCWIMVINIVAIEMLESRFNPSANLDNIMSNGHHLTQPNFISIFDHKQGPNGHKSSKLNNKEEDPYSIPANASTDSKSSSNNYGTTSTRNMSTINSSQSNRGHRQSGQYNGRSSNHQYNHHLPGAIEHGQSNMHGNRSGSNNNIYGSASIVSSLINQHHQYPANVINRGANNNIVPPKLPPRAHAMKSHSKSSNNISNYPNDNAQQSMVSPSSNNKYNNNDNNNNRDDCDASQHQKNRKTKRNRFLDTLQLPMNDLTNSKSSPSLVAASGYDQSVGSPNSRSKGTDTTNSKSMNNNGVNTKKSLKKSSKSKKISDGLKSLKSSSSKTKISSNTNNSDEDSYANVEEDVENPRDLENDADDVDSVVDGLDENGVASMSNGNIGIHEALDIPTPDYETDENIYSIDSNFQMPKSCMQQIYNKQKSLAKEDLYYSGLQARVPQNISNRHYSRKSQQQSYSHDKRNINAVTEQRPSLSGKGPTWLTSNNTKEKSNANHGIVASGNNINLSSARYRSTSMQRYYPRPDNDGKPTGGYEYENPYSVDGYNIDHTSSRDYGRRSNYAINGISNKQLATAPMSNVNYEIGRSSSGIYGNNSSSSSSDYADWHPQMRKHNSSGYLNSLFRNHVASPIFYNTKSVSSSNNRNGSNQQQLSTLSKQQQKEQLQYGNCIVQTKSKQQVAIMHSNQKLQHQLVASNITSKRTTIDGNYRTYDSSNDSDPSYTNSSDGLDIYDQIGAHKAAALEHQGSFVGPPTVGLNHHNHHQRELYVGEWENL